MSTVLTITHAYSVELTTSYEAHQDDERACSGGFDISMHRLREAGLRQPFVFDYFSA